MASGSKPRSAKQGVSYANVASGTTAIKLASSLETTPAAATDAITVLQATLQKAMQEMAQVSDILMGLQTDVKSVKSCQAKMKTDVAAIYERLDQADSRIMDLEMENGRLSKEVRERAKQHEDLQRAVQDAANRDRRLNLRLVGIKEKLESGAPREYVRRIISEILGIHLAENELQRVHRSLAPMPNEGQPPRPIIMRFHSYLERDRVLNAARERYRERREMKWQGDNISFFPDMTREVVEKRRKISDVRKKLHEMDVRFTLAYPAVIRFTWKGRRVSFEDHRKAMELITKEAERE